MPISDLEPLIFVPGDTDPFEAIRKEEACLEDIPGLPIDFDDSDEGESITLQYVKKLSKLLVKIVQWNNAKRIHKNSCKKLRPGDSNEW